MLKKLVLLSFALVAAGSYYPESFGAPAQDAASSPRGNQCVDCHARVGTPREVAGRYLDWHFSAHGRANVGCNSCHGGDPAATDAATAHRGVIPSVQAGSRLHRTRLPETCGACHKAVVNSFVESTHYKVLAASGLGPSCTTCHGHMASSVAAYPIEAAALCTRCHNTIDGLLPRRPEIPQYARDTMEAIVRANYMATLAAELLAEAERRKVDVAAEADDLRLMRGTLAEARVGWHAFTVGGVQAKAEKAFEDGVRVRDALSKKLGRK
jgi:hypothetical protein